MKPASFLILMISIFLCRCGSQEDPYFPNRPLSKLDFSEATDSARTIQSDGSTTQMSSPGESIINSEVVPGPNDITFRCLDSLNAETYASRQYYFQVFKRISANPGSLSEALLGTYLWDFLLHHADEFIGHYKSMTSYERNEMACYLSAGEQYSQSMHQSSYLKRLEALAKTGEYPADLRKNLEFLKYDIISYGGDDNE